MIPAKGQRSQASHAIHLLLAKPDTAGCTIRQPIIVRLLKKMAQLAGSSQKRYFVNSIITKINTHDY